MWPAMMISVLDRVENVVVKGENASDQHFLLLPQCFQKSSVSGSFKLRIVYLGNKGIKMKQEINGHNPN